MREMKNSEIGWIGEIPKHWKLSKLKYICEIQNHLRKAVSAENRTQEASILYDYYGASGVIDKIDGYTCEGKRILIGEDGANLLMRNLPLIYIADGKYWVNNHAHILQPFTNVSFDFIALQMEAADYFNHITGSAQPKLSQKNLKEIPFVIAPLPEQQRIADYLDAKCAEINAVIAKTKATIEEYKTLKQSVITEAVTKGLNPDVEMKDSGIEWIGEIPSDWNTYPLKRLFSFGKGLPITKENLTEHGVSVINYGQIHSKSNNGLKINSNMIKHVDEKYLTSNPQSLVNKRDFIFADTSEDLDGVGNFIYIADEQTLFAGYHSIILKSCESDFAHYLAYFFLSDSWRSQLRCKVSGIKVFSISQKILKQTFVVLPPLPTQQQIADHLDVKCAEIDTLIAKKQTIVTELENYKKSLIYECVTGKVEI